MDVDDQVIVPPTTCPLSTTEMAELKSLYDPLSPSDDFAIINVLHFVSSRLA